MNIIIIQHIISMLILTVIIATRPPRLEHGEGGGGRRQHLVSTATATATATTTNNHHHHHNHHNHHMHTNNGNHAALPGAAEAARNEAMA